MTDDKELIERLRKQSSNPWIKNGELCLQAADTIARLEAERDAARELAGAYWRLHRMGAIGTYDDALEDECEHLRHIATSAAAAIRAAMQGK